MTFDKLFDIAEKKGVEAIQVFVENTTEIQLEVFKGELDKHEMSDTRVVTIQGIYNGKMGKMRTEIIDEALFEEWVGQIMESAKLIESKDEVFIYAGSDEYETVEGLFEEPLDTLDIAEKIKMTFDLDQRISELDERIDIRQSFYSETRKRVWLQNSKGLMLEKDVNSALLGCQVVARDGKDSRSAFDYVQSNVIEDFDTEKIAKGAVEKAVSLLGAKAIPSDTYEILLENAAAASLLHAYVSMFNADNVQKGMSKLVDKLGETIASDNITIVDDPFMRKSHRSGAFDDEGVKTTYKEIVGNGTLNSFLHNLKTAKKADTESTGNAFGGNVAPTNFYVRPGETAFADALQSMKKGLLITDLQGTHAGTDAISGNFSLQAGGFLVEDGKRVKPVALITVAGNYLDFMKNVTAVCDDLKFNFGFIGSPSIKIKSLVVSGE